MNKRELFWKYESMWFISSNLFVVNCESGHVIPLDVRSKPYLFCSKS